MTEPSSSSTEPSWISLTKTDPKFKQIVPYLEVLGDEVSDLNEMSKNIIQKELKTPLLLFEDLKSQGLFEFWYVRAMFFNIATETKDKDAMFFLIKEGVSIGAHCIGEIIQENILKTALLIVLSSIFWTMIAGFIMLNVSGRGDTLVPVILYFRVIVACIFFIILTMSYRTILLFKARVSAISKLLGSKTE